MDEFEFEFEAWKGKVMKQVILILVGGMVFLISSDAFAAAVAQPNAVSDTTAYLDPIIVTVLQALGVVVGAAATWALTRIAQNFGMKVTQQQVDAYDVALKKLVQYGAGRANELIIERGWNSLDVKNVTLANAINGAAEKFPDALAGVGLSPSDPRFEEKVKEGLERIYPTAMAEVANSPTTPPVTTEDLNRASAAGKI